MVGPITSLLETLFIGQSGRLLIELEFDWTMLTNETACPVHQHNTEFLIL